MFNALRNAKPGLVITLQGKQGTGKSTIGASIKDEIEKLNGNVFVKIVDNDQTVKLEVKDRRK
jgi:pantothenate kinase-related protein Tda10